MTVRNATAADLDSAAASLTTAFDRDPFSMWVVPDPAERAVGMRAMFEARLADVVAQGGTVLVTEDLGAAAIWLPPGMSADHSGPPDARPEVTSAFEAIHRTHPIRPHWYLDILGSASGQGGRGSALVGHMLAVTDAAAMPTALWTGNERNLDFYGKHGYGVVERLDFEGASVWWLWREAE